MTASPYPADIRRPGQRSATGHQRLLVFQISIAVQSRLELLEELLLQRIVQTGIFHLIAELGQQRVRIQLHILQHIRYGIALVGQLNLNAAVREDEHVHRLGIAEQVVHVAEDLLIGANHEEAQHRRVLRVVFRHRHGGGDPVAVHVVIDGAIGIAGDVQQHRAALRRLVQPFQRHHREQLIDPPGIRHRLDLPSAVVNLSHLAVVQPFAQRAAVAGLVHLQPGFPHALQRTRSVFRRRGRLGVFVTLNADDVGNQHGMVRGHRAAGLGDHRRVRQAILFAGIADRPDDIVGVFVQTVVHRAIGLRAGAFIVHAQAAADVEALNIDTQLM
ncbi:Uncharacterised protein [Klebsiella pneumoniae]|nr:Uncharacterised protein [Klebsiella pneumoniae]